MSRGKTHWEDTLADHLSGLADGLRGRRKVARNEGDDEEEDEDYEEEERTAEPNNFAIVRDDDGIPVVAKTHHLKFKHKTIRSLYNEWYGLDEFDSVPLPGGINKLELDHKNGWRKHFSGSENKHHSRVKRVIKGIKKQAMDDSKSPIEVIDAWEAMFEGELKCSVSKLEEWMKTKGLLRTLAARGKKARTS